MPIVIQVDRGRPSTEEEREKADALMRAAAAFGSGRVTGVAIVVKSDDPAPGTTVVRLLSNPDDRDDNLAALSRLARGRGASEDLEPAPVGS